MSRAGQWGALALVALTAFASGCAKDPPGRNTLAGKRLIVTIRFRGTVLPTYHYFFLINNAGDQNAPGPIPVLFPPYGNGFATGFGNSTAGFTDFVRFDNQQANNGYGLYHVIANSNLSQFRSTGYPISSTPPGNVTGSDTVAPRTLRFELDLSQLITDPTTGAPLTDQTQAVEQSRSIRYLQCNIVATDVVPTDPNTQIPREVDAMFETGIPGNNSAYASTVNSFLTIDLGANQTQYRTYTSTDANSINGTEPDAPDQFTTNGDPLLDALDIESWTIEFQAKN